MKTVKMIRNSWNSASWMFRTAAVLLFFSSLTAEIFGEVTGVSVLEIVIGFQEGGRLNTDDKLQYNNHGNIRSISRTKYQRVFPYALFCLLFISTAHVAFYAYNWPGPGHILARQKLDKHIVFGGGLLLTLFLWSWIAIFFL